MDELLDNCARLRGQGIVPHACLDHGMTMSFAGEFSPDAPLDLRLP
jgi:hypothetical protein